MNTDLLNTPERRNGILPELIDFFRSEHGDDWRGPTERFLRRFAGCEFVPPDHKALAEIDRDQQIVASLSVDDSVGRRLELMRQNKISYRYLQQIYMCVRGKVLQAPHCSSRASAIKEAADWMKRYPTQASEVASIYSLTAPEFGQAKAMTPGRAGRAVRARDAKKTAKKKAKAKPTAGPKKKTTRRR